MAASLRALRALLLLGGFYLLGFAMLAVLVGVDAGVVYAFIDGGHAIFALGKILIVSLALTVPIVRGMFAFRRPRGDDGPSGVTVTPEQQPELWSEITESARLSGTRPPTRLVLTGSVNAAVAERTHLLGLIPGRRSMYLGVPLLAGLTRPRLRAVLAHEFGHYGNQDTRLAGITMRGRDAVGRTVDAFRAGAAGGSNSHAVVGGLYVRYARLYLRVSHSVGRRQELAADLAAARIAGRDTTAAALREIPVLDSAFGFYVNRYATLGWPSSLLPPAGEFYGGFSRLLAAPGRETELAELRAELPASEQTAYDSHPPIADRVRIIAGLPDDGRPDDPAAPPALDLLRDRAAVLTALESATLAEPAAAMRHMATWEELAHTAARSARIEAALPLQRAAAAEGFGTDGRPAGLTGVLAAIDAGRLWTTLAGRLPKSADHVARATGRAAREFLRPSVRDGLAALTHLGLADTGRAHWSLFWSGPGPVRFVLPEITGPAPAASTASPAPGSPAPASPAPASPAPGAHASEPFAADGGYAAALDAALDAAVADDPDTGLLRELLAATPAPVAARAMPDPAAAPVPADRDTSPGIPAGAAVDVSLAPDPAPSAVVAVDTAVFAAAAVPAASVREK